MSLNKKYWVYLIISQINKKVVSYVGYTQNINKRLDLHNSNRGAKFTRGKKWKMVYKEAHYSKSEALKAEYKLKKDYKLRNKIKNNFI